MRGSRRYAAIFVAAYLAALIVIWLNGPAKVLNINDYISDEVWYVSSAVNVARSVLGIHIVPRTGNGTVVYTVFYNSTACSLEEAEQLVVSLAPGVHVLNHSYEKIDAFVVEAPLGAARVVETLPREAKDCIEDLMPGIAPDTENINTYLNTEHPPLVKYIIAAVIALAGWRPAAWRLASFAAAALGLAAATYAAYRAFNEQRRRSLAVAALSAAIIVAAAARDPSIPSMASVGMLDVYSASLDALALALLLSRRHRASSLTLGLAGAAKYTGLFPLPVNVLAIRLETGSTRKALAIGLVLPILVVAASWAPFAASRGPLWVVNEVVGALVWHTTSRPPGPPSTTPIGMLTGRNGFVLYYAASGKPLLTAVCNPGVCLIGVALGAAMAGIGVFSACLGARGRRQLVLLANGGYPFAAWLGYVAVYAAGNHTLYSFYSVQLSLLSIPALATIPLLVEEAPSLNPRKAMNCLFTNWAPYAAASTALAGVAASAALAGGWPHLPPSPAMDPLFSSLDPGSKISRIGVFASAALVYAATAARTTPRARRPREGARHGLRWLLAGLLSYSGASAPLAPVLYLAAIRPGAPEALLAGLAGPGPAGYLAAAHRARREQLIYAIGYTVGLLASLAVLEWSMQPVLRVTGVVFYAAAAGAALALYSLAQGQPLLSFSAAAALDPSAAPLLALAPRGVPVAAAAAAMYAFTGASYVRVVALAGLAVGLAGIAQGEETRNNI